MAEPVLDLPSLIRLRKARGLTEDQVAARMGILVSNFRKLEDRFRSGGKGVHATTVFDYVAAIGYPFQHTFEDLVRHRILSGLSEDDVAAAMGITADRVRQLEAKLTAGGGGSIQTVLAYAVVIGRPLTPTEDPAFAPSPQPAPLQPLPQPRPRGWALRERAFAMADLVRLRKARGLTEDQVASRMVISVGNLRRLETALLSGGKGLHARTVFDYVAAIGYPFQYTFEDLVRHRIDSDLSVDDVAAAMGIEPRPVYRLERKLNAGGGGRIHTVLAYSVAIGKPLTPTEDPVFAPPPQRQTAPPQPRRRRGTRLHLAAARERLADEARQLHANGDTIPKIAARLQKDRKTVERYLNTERVQQQTAKAQREHDRRRHLAAEAHKLVEDDKSNAEICELLGISESSLLRYMKMFPAEPGE
ncbi:hypothetical protein [Nonomuraea sp. NPDC049400]|uniref:hypothetical protein n=1 Tax=Nonomuraea sp. NPDC049400 TaxID=3364352 RepID=UPI00378B7963